MLISMPTAGFSSTGNIFGSGIYAAAGSYGYWNVEFDSDTSASSSGTSSSTIAATNATKIDVDVLNTSNVKTLPAADTLSPDQIKVLQVLVSIITVVEIALLYEAALNRKPDVGGLNYWYDRAVEDLSTKDIAQSLISSAEFARNFGDPNKISNDQFVTTVYTNVLNRAPEPAGKAFWVQQLSGGMSRTDVLGNIAVSQENSAGAHYLETLGINDNGWYF